MFENLKINRILKRNLNGEEYKKLPIIIQKDERIITHLIKCSPKDISYIDDNIDISKYVLDNYELFYYLNTNQKNNIFYKLDLSKIDVTKEIFTELDKHNKILIFQKYPLKYFYYFEKKEKIEIIKECLLKKIGHDFGINDYGLKDKELFTEEEFENIILNLSSDELYEILPLTKSFIYLKEIIEKIDNKRLIELYNEDNRIIEYLPNNLKEVINIHIAGDNIEKIKNLSIKEQVKILEEKPYLLRALDDKVIENFIMSRNNITALNYVELGNKASYMFLKKIPFEEMKKLISSNFEYAFLYTSYTINDSKSNEYLKKIIYSRLDELENIDKRNKLKIIFSSLTTKRIGTGYSIYENENYQISKLLYDKKIIENNDIELIEKYIKTLDRDLLIKILSNAYGSHVIEIFAKRPNLDLTNFENFCILNKNIYETLGIGFINYVLNCNLYLYNYLIYQISENEKLLNIFKKYLDTMTNEIDNIDINLLTNLIEKFIQNEDILSNIDYDNITDEIKENTILYINDPKKVSVFIKNIEDIKNYKTIRTKKYSEIIYNSNNTETIKTTILEYLLNTEVIDRTENSSIESLSLEQTIKAFDINNIVNNEDLIKKIGLTKNEVAILLLLNEINRINNIDTLKEIFESIQNNKLDTSIARTVLNKIKNYCTKNIINNLTTNDKLNNMDFKEIEGIKVIPFEGEDFTLLISVLGMNMNNYGMHDARIESPTGLLYEWLAREEGSNSISTALVSSETSIYPLPKTLIDIVDKHPIFIFNEDINIKGMGASDISTTKEKNNRRHAFSYIMQNSFKFTDMDKLKELLKTDRKDERKFLSELAISRFEEDIRKKEAFKRVMPIGLYVIGEIQEKDLSLAKLFNKYYKEYGLGEFKIIQINPKAYNERIEKTEGDLYEFERRKYSR